MAESGLARTGCPRYQPRTEHGRTGPCRLADKISSQRRKSLATRHLLGYASAK